MQQYITFETLWYHPVIQNMNDLFYKLGVIFQCLKQNRYLKDTHRWTLGLPNLRTFLIHFDTYISQ